METRRWGVAAAGIVLQIVLGAVYAWSVFRAPLVRQFHWTISEVTLTFTICILVLGFAAFLGGLWLARSSPRVVGVTGAFLFGLGVFLASFSGPHLLWLYLTFGVIGGTGLGFAYIVPVSVLVKWFPDRRGLITGLAVGGFGLGALITAPVATHLIASIGVLRTFAYLGLAYMILGVIAAFFLVNPPEGWVPEGWTAPAGTQRSTEDYTLAGALRTWQWWVLWFTLFLNTSAGISLISQESPVFQELGGLTAVIAAGMVGIVSIGNAVGRVFWAWVSDAASRRWTFVGMFLIQVVAFWFLPSLRTAAVITSVSFLILMCYGGGFGTMPAFAADYFGPKNVGTIYGLMLTAWGAASAFGPLLVAHLRESSGTYATGFHALSGILIVSTILPLILRPPAATGRRNPAHP